MSRAARAARAAVLVVGIVAGALGLAGTVASAAPPTQPPVTTTTVAGAPGVTTPDDAGGATTTLPPAGARGSAADGSVAKPESETWSPRRIATMTLIAVVALAAIGYAYGKLRSAPPRHPDLVRRPPDLDGVDPVDARS